MKRPIPITLLSAEYVLTTVFGLWSISKYTTYSSLVIGIYLAGCVLFIALAYGLWEMKEFARQVAVFGKGFALVTTGIGILGLGWSILSGRGSWLQTRSPMVLLALVAEGIPFFYLRDPRVKQIFRRTIPLNTNQADSMPEIYNFNLKWIIWVACTIGISILSIYQVQKGGAGINSNADLSQMLPSLKDLERKVATATPDKRFYALSDLAKAAFRENQFDKAKAYAQELLDTAAKNPSDWNYGNAVHQGHLILGRLALREGRVEDAKTELLEAGKTPGSPQLNSFGPNMMLAKELLERNEKQTVLNYFSLCRRFWSSKFSKLDEWTATVQQGGIPNFGANLYY